MPKVDEDPPIVISGPRLAVNLFDLDRVDPIIREMALAKLLDLAAGAIRTDPDDLDEAAVMFKCPLMQAASMCDVLRAHDREAGDYPTRVYVKRRRAWTKIAGNVRLTLTVGNKGILNPDVFNPDAGSVSHVPLPARRVEL